MHSAGDSPAPTALEVLSTVLARDTRHTSAVEALRQEYTDATDPQRVEALYRHGADLAATAFTAATLPEYIDALPRAYAHQIDADPELRTEIAHAWTEAALAGLDPREMWAQATDTLDTAKSAGAVIAHRIRHVTREVGEKLELPIPPPETTTGDPELATWLTDTRHTLTTAPAESPAATVSDFTTSYLAHRAAEREHGPDTHTASPSAWGPVTDSSPDLW